MSRSLSIQSLDYKIESDIL